MTNEHSSKGGGNRSPKVKISGGNFEELGLNKAAIDRIESAVQQAIEKELASQPVSEKVGFEIGFKVTF